MLAIRGAIQVEKNSPAAISDAVAALCEQITRANRLTPGRMVSAIFTLTPDLSAAFPARAARKHGWDGVPMICAQEIPVRGAPPRICRVLLHVQGRGRPRHVYLGGALDLLRPDLAGRHERRAAARRKRRSSRG
jgi:chorismate mutase